MSSLLLELFVSLVAGTLLIVLCTTKKSGSECNTLCNIACPQTQQLIQQLNQCDDIKSLNALCHDLFMEASYGSCWKNKIGFIGKISEHMIALDRNDTEMLQDFKHRIVRDFNPVGYMIYRNQIK